PTVRFAVNQEFVVGDLALKDGDEVAVIPPVSGGEETNRTWVELVDEPIPVARVRAFVSGDPSLGAITTFEGATRDDSHELHGPVVRLEYEAYREMAVKQMERLVKEAMNRWSLGRVAMIHRLGSVGPAEISIMIAVASGHREESFVACRWLIDTLKKDVPIWKKDVFADGTVEWVTPEGVSPEPTERDG
ncbi:MAG: molybdenum cofactor biosynthesis protein MoaE, partial [Planctomycetes bacterium]|nr:molybdenum cofactor biosynthesis protein MoaE [Planctomycetota bacterium]